MFHTLARTHANHAPPPPTPPGPPPPPPPYLHTHAHSPPPWKLGAAYIKAERRLRNPEGEAKARRL